MEEIREEIATWLHDYTTEDRRKLLKFMDKSDWEDLPKEWRIDIQESWREKADEFIKSIKGLRIEADNQDLPDRKCPTPSDDELDFAAYAAYITAQQDMLKEDWVKCRKKEEQHGL